MTDSYHLAIYPDLDPVKVARIADGYGIEAAIERWSPGSPRSIADAADRGREIMQRSKSADAGAIGRRPSQP